MGSIKTTAVKRRLAKKLKQNASVPIWVIGKTQGKVRRSSKQRNWRKSSLKV